MTAKIVTANPTPPNYKPRTADTMSNAEIRRKLCFGSCETCKVCEVLDFCRYGQEGIKREIRQGRDTDGVR